MSGVTRLAARGSDSAQIAEVWRSFKRRNAVPAHLCGGESVNGPRIYYCPGRPNRPPLRNGMSGRTVAARFSRPRFTQCWWRPSWSPPWYWFTTACPLPREISRRLLPWCMPLTEAQVRSVSCPVLAIFGDRSWMVPLAPVLRDVVPQSRIEVLDGFGHFILAEATVRVRELLTEWLFERRSVTTP